MQPIDRKLTDSLARAVVCDLYGKTHEQELLFLLTELIASLHVHYSNLTQKAGNGNGRIRNGSIALDFNSFSLKLLQEYNLVIALCIVLRLRVLSRSSTAVFFFS